MMKKNRLVLYLTDFPQVSETFIVRMFLGLLNQGWDVHIVCTKSEKENWQKFPELQRNAEAQKRVHKTWPVLPRYKPLVLMPLVLFRLLIGAPRKTWGYLIRGFHHFGWDVFRRCYLDAEIILLNPSLLHFEFGTLAVGRTYLKDLLGLKLSVSFRGYDLNFVGLDDPNYYSEVWNKVDACHFLGNDLWERAQRRGCPPEMPHVLITPAVDLSSFPQPKQSRPGKLGTPEQPLQILSVGRLAWKKGYEFSLMAIKKLIDEGYECNFKIIGDGPYKPALKFACHQMGIDESVEFLGSLPHEGVIDWLNWPDIFLHGAVSEGFCNAVLEAQTMGVPVVCTDADGLPENVKNNLTGFIVPRRNPAAMAEKIALLAVDSILRKKMGNAGQKRVREKFLLKRQIEKFEGFFNMILRL